MIPYISPSDIDVGPVQWFGVTLAIAIFIGFMLVRRRAPTLGIEPDWAESLGWWVVIGGFFGGHALGELVYSPQHVVREPWKLFYLWESQSSLPGFTGTAIGALLWKRFHWKGRPLMPMSEIFLSIFPIAWFFGRLGCTFAHDHPGKAATGPFRFLAVDYPRGNIQGIPAGPHWNLGLLEMLLTLGMSVLLMLMWRRRWPIGTYTATTFLLYGPVRFLLDFLRTGDALYFGLTPGQYGSLVMVAFAIFVLFRMRAGAFEPERAEKGI